VIRIDGADDLQGFFSGNSGAETRTGGGTVGHGELLDRLKTGGRL